MLNDAHAAQSDLPIRDIIQAHAPRRLRRPAGQDGAAHRHGGRVQPAGLDIRR
jgi:hypothetical protein